MVWSVGEIIGAFHARGAPTEQPDAPPPRVELAQAQVPALPSRATLIDAGKPAAPQLTPPGTARPAALDMSGVVAEGSRSTIALESLNANRGAFIATGVSVEPGYATTAAHFARNNLPIYYEATNSKGERVIGRAQVVGCADELDVALLKLEHTDITAVRISTRQLRPGEPVAVIGSPNGLTDSATVGYVSGLHRYPGGPICDCFQTDAAINRGNSGGGVFNAEGELTGQAMSTIDVLQGGFQGLGFAIPAATLRRLIPRLKKGDVTPIPTGIGLAAPTLEDSYKAGRRTLEGALVDNVAPGSPAARAGLQKNDVIVEINGTRMTGIADTLTECALAERGQPMRMLVRRGGQTLSLTLVK